MRSWKIDESQKFKTLKDYTHNFFSILLKYKADYFLDRKLIYRDQICIRDELYDKNFACCSAFKLHLVDLNIIQWYQELSSVIYITGSQNLQTLAFAVSGKGGTHKPV